MRQTRRKIRYATVDSLQASFDKIDGKAKLMIQKGCTDKALQECLQRLWTQQFHQHLARPAVLGLLKHYRALYGSGKRTTQKAQKGGMAPLEYTMGQGSTEPYGRFPVFEGSSPKFVHDLGTVNRTFESSIGASCTRQTGGRSRRNKKQSGGGVDLLPAAVRMGHAPFSVPANGFQTTVSAVQGVRSRESSDPTVPAWRVNQFTPSTFDAKPYSSFELSPVYNGY